MSLIIISSSVRRKKRRCLRSASYQSSVFIIAGNYNKYWKCAFHIRCVRKATWEHRTHSLWCSLSGVTFFLVNTRIKRKLISFRKFFNDIYGDFCLPISGWAIELPWYFSILSFYLNFSRLWLYSSLRTTYSCRHWLMFRCMLKLWHGSVSSSLFILEKNVLILNYLFYVYFGHIFTFYFLQQITTKTKHIVWRLNELNFTVSLHCFCWFSFVFKNKMFFEAVARLFLLLFLAFLFCISL